MKVLLTADLHAIRPWYEWLARRGSDWDVVAIAGDLVDMFAIAGIQPDIAWLTTEWRALWKATGRTLAVCDGNHDLDPGWLSELGEPASVIAPPESRAVRAEDGSGLVITSCPYPGGLASESIDPQRVWSEGASLRRKTGLPWLVLFHEPPASLVDANGSHDLDQWIEEFAPNYVFGGHVHDFPKKRRAFAVAVGPTWYLNAGQMPGERIPNRIVLDTYTRTAAWTAGSGADSETKLLMP